ncbi:hypothetical protein ACIB24_22495 [Spongisporangium articulatum]|uniref:Uncharacterized protein n=1 Tax=Spongisporangium articulatum TaxID=3362603 RepID=A0ABW8AU07_9ACTN
MASKRQVRTTTTTAALAAFLIGLSLAVAPSATARSLPKAGNEQWWFTALGPEGRDDSSGFGIARPLRAIVDNVPADAPTPIFDELGLAALLVAIAGGAIAFIRTRRRPHSG